MTGAAEQYPRWAETIDSADGGQTVRIPGYAPDGSETAGIVVGGEKVAVLASMLAGVQAEEVVAVGVERPCLATEHCELWGWCSRCAPALGRAGGHVLAALRAAGVTVEYERDVYGKIMLLLDAMTVEMRRKKRP